MSIHDEAPQSGHIAYRMAYAPGDNPFPRGTSDHRRWDREYWQEHDDAAAACPSDDGIEAGYGDFFDYDAVSQGMYDDDPSPYLGTYSEE